MPLTPDDLTRLLEAIDSHIYWQLSDRQSRNAGAVTDPGSDDTDTVLEIKAYRSLADTLQALLTSASPQPVDPFA